MSRPLASKIEIFQYLLLHGGHIVIANSTPICENVMSSTKLEIRSIQYRIVVKGGWSHSHN